MKITFLILFNILLLCKSTTIIELNEESLNNLIESNKNDKNKILLIIFYANNCENCQEALNIISNDINEYKNNKIQFGKINCDLGENIWLNIRFNITRIPYIILIKGNNYYELNSNYDKYEIYRFINDKKDKIELLNIPNKINLIKKILIIINLAHYNTNIYSKKYFNTKISINLMIFMIILFFIIFFWIIYYIVIFCCCNLCFYKFWKKNKNKEIIEIIKNDNASQTTSNVSGSELGSQVDSDLNISGITDSIFKEEIDEKEIVKKYKKKIE
jgi:thiol-disulfide isomerase/thioredoxin